MSCKSFRPNIERRRSYNGQKGTPQQHSDFKKLMSEQLRAEMDELLKITTKLSKQQAEYFEQHTKCKQAGNLLEAEQKHSKYRMLSDQHHRTTAEVMKRLRAVRKLEKCESMERYMMEMEMRFQNERREDQERYGPLNDDQ